MSISDMGRLMTGALRFEIKINQTPEDEIKAMIVELRAVARRRNWHYSVDTPMIWTDGEWDRQKPFGERKCRADIFGQFDACSEEAIAEILQILSDYDVDFGSYRLCLDMHGGLKPSITEEVPF